MSALDMAIGLLAVGIGVIALIIRHAQRVRENLELSRTLNTRGTR